MTRLPEWVPVIHNWDTYPFRYNSQQRQMIADFPKMGRIWMIDDCSIDDGKLVINGGDIHPNVREIFQTIIDLNPRAIFECGCGSGRHIANIKKFMPGGVKLGGCDINKKQWLFNGPQVGVPEETFSLLKEADLTQEDQIQDFISEGYDFIYSQAVVMHQSYDKACKMLTNMAKISTKYILMVESSVYYNYDVLISDNMPGWKKRTIKKWDKENKKFVEDKAKVCGDVRGPQERLSILLEKETL